MNHETNALLQQLASKLGTTTEYLWKVLVSQAQISAAFSAVEFLFMFLSPLFLFPLHKFLKRICEDEFNECYEHPCYIIPMILVAIIVVVLFCCSFEVLRDAINGFYNPQYWALNELLNHLRPLKD